jgi:TetR/AcrR family transcriptional regulator, transcriptional repressor for nem operon
VAARLGETLGLREDELRDVYYLSLLQHIGCTVMNHGVVPAVIARRREQLLDQEMPLLAKLDSWTAIEQWIDMNVGRPGAQGFRVGCRIGSLANELADRDEDARRDLVECCKTWPGYLVDGLERMRARSELVQYANPEEPATAVFAGMQGGLLLAKTRKEAGPLRIALDAALVFLRSSAPDRPRSKPAWRKGQFGR